jgi:hypothetical protein
VFEGLDEELKAEYHNWALAPWELSIEACCQAAYLADIPASAIKVVATDKQSAKKTAGDLPSLEYVLSHLQ